MSVTVGDVYNTVCDALLEPWNYGVNPGLSVGVFTDQQFLDLFSTVLYDFLEKTGMVKAIWSTQVLAGIEAYVYPDLLMRVDDCFLDAKILEQSEMDTLDSNVPDWTIIKTPQPTPRYWHQLANGTSLALVEIAPRPNFTGEAFQGLDPPIGEYDTFGVGMRDLTIVATSAPSKSTWVLGDTIDTIPDSFTVYLSYGILQRIFSTDGETKDEQKALYCKSRYEEGVMLARLISGEPNDEE